MNTKPVFNALLLSGLLIAPLAYALNQAELWADKAQSSLSYSLVHPLHEVKATSHKATSRITIDPATQEVKKVDVIADVNTFDSGDSNRDSHALEVIDGIKYPKVKFTSSSISTKGDKLSVTGQLYFHGVTKEITFPVELHRQADKVVADGSFVVSLEAYKIERPSILMMPVEDGLTITFHMVYQQPKS